ncbi:hypothetical protein O9929_23375 [Vibrio lentus]|nr:hypothetical protein [Vibrio lentus]
MQGEYEGRNLGKLYGLFCRNIYPTVIWYPGTGKTLLLALHRNGFAPRWSNSRILSNPDFIDAMSQVGALIRYAQA